MAFLRDQIKNLAGKYFPGGSPTFSGATPSSGTNYTHTTNMLNDHADVWKTNSSNLFSMTATDPFNKGTTYFELAGTIPPGFSFDQRSGVLSGGYYSQGINTNGLVYSFTITAFSGTNPNQSVSRNYTITLSVPWQYRQIISTSYMCGGYKSSTLWSNVNRLIHATETSANLGDNNIDNFHYKSGWSGDTKVYIWNGTTTAFNMRTESRSNSGASPGGGNNGTNFEPNRTYGWVNGEGVGQVKKWTASSETFANLGSGWNDHSTSISNDTKGVFWGNSGQTQRVIFSTDAIANMGYSAGAHGQQKGLNAKNGYGYGGAQGGYDSGSQFRRTDISSETQSNTYTKPWNCGEENYTPGQTVGFMQGQHDPSGQNNRSFRYVYASESGTQGGSSLEPKGQQGCSSGHYGWRD